MSEFAIMRKVRVGASDRGQAALMFTTDLIDGLSADHWLTGEQMTSFIESAGHSDVRSLNGQSCIVERDNGIVRVVGPAPRA